MQSQQLNLQTLKPEIQAILDICEIQGVPVWYENGLFMIKKVGAKHKRPINQRYSSTLGTQNIDTILRWIETWKQWNKNETY
jgi:hypothetical protein